MENVTRKGFRATYEVMTPESTENCDAEDRGYFVDGHRHSTEGLWGDNPELLDLRERAFYEVEDLEDAYRFLRYEGVNEASCSPVYLMGEHDWFLSREDVRPTTHEQVTFGFHPEGFTAQELRDLAKR